MQMPAVLYCPGEHCLAKGLVDPGAQPYPSTHWPVHRGLVRPAVAPNRPAWHGPAHSSVVVKGRSPYLPGRQGEHVSAPAREYVPMGQALPLGDRELSLQLYPAMQEAAVV